MQFVTTVAGKIMAHHGQFWGNDVDWTAPAAFAINQLPPTANENWLGGSGGNGNWNTPANWSQDSVPGPSASVTFANGGLTYDVSGNATIGAMTVIDDAVTYTGTITQDSGSAGKFLTMVSDVQGAHVMIATGSVLNAEHGTIDCDGYSVLSVEGTLMIGGGTANNIYEQQGGGTVVTTAPMTIHDLSMVGGDSFTGDIILTSGGNISVGPNCTIDGGSITLLGSGGIGAGSAGSTYNFTDPVALEAGGTLTLVDYPGATLTMTGKITGDGGLLIYQGTTELDAADTYTGRTIVQYANLIVDGRNAVPSGLIALLNGGLTTQADSTGAVNFTDSVVGFGTTDTVNAAAGNLLVFASQSGLFTFLGGAGTDTLIGGTGELSVRGGAAGDLVFSNAASLLYMGGAGHSTVVGGSGAMTATGGTGGDAIFSGTSGQDVLNTGAGPTTLVGGQGALLYATGAGNSLLVDGGGGAYINASASAGNDTLFGGKAGSDTIISGTGTNVVGLGAGTTTLYTRGTADVFAGTGAFSLAYIAGIGGGVTNVVGFDLRTDHIALAGYADGTAQQILASETIAGGNTILDIPQGGNQVILFGTTGLTLANFT